jgi:hypothetical protein
VAYGQAYGASQYGTGVDGPPLVLFQTLLGLESTTEYIQPAPDSPVADAAFGLIVSAADVYWLSRNMSVGLSYLAGPQQWIEWPQGTFGSHANFGITPSSSFTANWQVGEALAVAHGFSSLANFVSVWDSNSSVASSLGVSFDSNYVLSEQVAAILSTALGFDSTAAFQAAYFRAQTITSKLGFSSLSSFLAVWEEAQIVGARFGIQLDSLYYGPNEAGQTMAIGHGVKFSADFRGLKVAPMARAVYDPRPEEVDYNTPGAPRIRVILD